MVRRSVRPSTEKQYEYPLRRYYDWCSARGLDPVDTTPVQVTNFLADMAGEHKLSQSALAVYRSAVSKANPGCFGVPIGLSRGDQCGQRCRGYAP